jgi:hypothetical protein
MLLAHADQRRASGWPSVNDLNAVGAVALAIRSRSSLGGEPRYAAGDKILDEL